MAGAPSSEGLEGWRMPPLSIMEASELTHRLATGAFRDIRRLANILRFVNLDSRREDLLDYIRSNRARFLKAYAIISWLSGSHGELVINASRALTEARSQREQIDTCQDQFFFMHGGLFGARQRPYDVPVAVDVLVGGRYPRLPKGIQYCGGDINPRPVFELPANREEIVTRMNRAIRLALLRRGGVPNHFTGHVVRSGVLTLTVDGEFELQVTLQGERENARWNLLGVAVKVQARQGESITAPTADFRQQRYLREVVQKAMDVHADADAKTRLNPLLAAYQVCHDMCCSMVLEILHAQAHKLAARVGGLWATQLVVVFHKNAQVLDLCLWQREFSSGLGGTGRDVGIGGVRFGEAPVRPQQAATTPRLKEASTAALPPPPVGCRYVRVHRPADRHSKMVASLGPPAELLRGRDLGRGRGNHPEASEMADRDAFLASSVQVHLDQLSCAQMLLAAARTFAAQKIKTLAADVEAVAGLLGTCVPQVSTVGGVSACICPWGGGSVEVSVDVKSGRYLVKDILPSNSKAMTSCISRLREALNLLPRTDSQSLGESIAATLSAGRSVLHKPSPSFQTARNGEQQNLRQQQVHRCLGESFGLLRRGEIERAFRCTLGVVPHGRWQALLGRTDTGVMDAGADLSRLDNSGTLRSSVRLTQFREDGVRLSDEWRKRTRSYRIRRRGASAIELTTAERAATVGQAATAAPAGGLNLEGLGSSSHWQHRGGGFPTLAASLAEVSEAEEFQRPVGRGGRPGVNGDVVSAPPPETTLETGEVLSFFLEVGITGSLDVEHTVISATLPTTGGARGSLRPVVGETYTLFPCQPLSASPCGSLEAALLPSEPPPVLGAKRGAAYLDAGDFEGTSEIAGGMDNRGCQGGLRSSKLHATVGSAVEAAQAQLHRAVQMYHRLVPFARLQHAFLRVGTGLSLDFRELTHFSGTPPQVPRCAVFLAGEHGWSSPEVAATSAKVSFFAGHTQADTWEWEVALGPTSRLMDYAGTGGRVAKVEDEETATTRKLVHQHLPLVQHLEIVGLAEHNVEGSAVVGGKHVKFRFPPPFSVHAMCRSFALAGEGLTAMQTLAAQASKLRETGGGGTGYRVVSSSPAHVAMRDPELDHVVLLTHSAFSERHISSAERPGLVLISSPNVSTCPAAMRELEASVFKHRDLNALLHGLSRTVALLAVVSGIVPSVGIADGVGGDRFAAGGGYVLSAVSPASFLLSAPVDNRHGDPRSKPKSALTLVVETGGRVRVSRTGEKDVVADACALRELLLEWIASTSRQHE